MDTVYKISSNGCHFNHNLNLANFALERGEGLAGDYMPADGTELGLEQWLRLVRTNTRRPTFLFPEQKAGPDLMFAYKE
jgi:hypothetical protein